MIFGKHSVLFSYLALALFLLLAKSSVAQDKISLITWADFNYTYNKSNKLGIGGDMGMRGIISKPNWGLVYVRPTLKYHFTPFIQVSGALGLFQTFQSDPSDMFEMRLAQEGKAEWPSFNNFYFIHRLRFEERFLFYNQADVVDNFDNQQQNFRFRYMLSVRSNYFKITNRAEYLYLIAGAEYFFPLGSNVDERFFNASRLSAGFGQELKLDWNYQVDLIWQRSRNTLEGNFTTDEFIIRLRVYFEQYKKEKDE
ncbi:DUF2490 domain-containing protein [Owenweeksia hongkongensis]|uniref:DUF2490 domain-containing protein n=1 Tax=Owenweeksia hongkongensis TaxID=253245 RepID=UPI003A94FBB6